MTRAVSRSRVVLPVSLFVAGLAISGFTIRRGIEPFDEGLTLQAARRVAAGQLPYRDFLWPYGPGQVYVLAGLLKTFGVSLLWWRVSRVLVDAAVALVVFVLVRRGGGSPGVALVAWLTAACAMAQPTAANPFAPALLFGLLAVLVAARAARDADRAPHRARLAGRLAFALAGGLCGFAAIFRLDFGVYAALGTLAATAFAMPSPRTALRACATVAATGLAVAVVAYAPFAVGDGPADAWRHLVGDSLRQGGYWRLPFPIGYDGRLRAWPPGSLAHDAKDVLEFYVPLLLLAGLALAGAGIVLAARHGRRPRPEAAGLAALALAYVPYLLSRTDEFHWAPLLVAVGGLIALLAPRAPRPLGAALALILIALLAYGAGNRLSALAQPPRLAEVHVAVADGVEAAPAEARAIEAMVRDVQRRVPRGAPIYTVTRRSDLVRINNPMVYVLTERDNPARQDFGLQTGAGAQRAIVAMLARARPRAIVRWTDPVSVEREPNARGRPTGVRIVDRWIGAHYRLAARHGYYDVLVPRSA